MMGIYPDCPGNMNYTITSPVFDKVEIDLHQDYYSNDKLVIETKNNRGDEHLLIDNIQLGKKPLSGFFVDHHELVKAGHLSIWLKK